MVSQFMFEEALAHQQSWLTGRVLTGPASLAGSDLRHLDLRFKNLSHMDLRNCILSGMDLTLTDFGGADLSGAQCLYTSFQGGVLKSTCFHAADFRDANLMQVSADGASFRHVVAQGTTFSGADLTDADFANALLQSCDVSRVKGVRCAMVAWQGLAKAHSILAIEVWGDMRVHAPGYSGGLQDWETRVAMMPEEKERTAFCVATGALKFFYNSARL